MPSSSAAYDAPMSQSSTDPHPPRFSDDDPYLARLREICLALPAAAEKSSHGRPTFFTKKTFAIFGGTVKGDHFDDRRAQSVLVLLEPSERAGLLADERFFVPAYHGAAGWIGLNFRPLTPDQVDWDEVAELVELSYRQTATVTLRRQLDARSG